jgi:hypothetical protein
METNKLNKVDANNSDNCVNNRYRNRYSFC